MSRYYHTHIWAIDEYNWFLDHPDMVFTVPACGEFYNATRNHKIPLLVMPEAMLPRGTNQDVRCSVCEYLNLQIKQGTIQDPDIWDDLAESPTC
jgi:hypothetical protein